MTADGTTSVDLLDSSAAELWLVAVVFFGVGDLVTTNVGLMTGWAAEVSPVAVAVIREYGFVAMYPLKATVFVGGFALWKVTPRPHAVGVPLGLAALGVVVTSWNAVVLLLAVS